LKTILESEKNIFIANSVVVNSNGYHFFNITKLVTASHVSIKLTSN